MRLVDQDRAGRVRRPGATGEYRSRPAEAAHQARIAEVPSSDRCEEGARADRVTGSVVGATDGEQDHSAPSVYYGKGSR